MKIVKDITLNNCCSGEAANESTEGKAKNLCQTELPHDVIIEILLRLPLKSLSRFKCACKFWYDLTTSSHDFIEKYTNKHKVSVFIDSCHTSTRRRKRAKTTLVSFRFSDVAVDLTIPVSREGAEIVGSARGLICLCLSVPEGMYLIWNPTTGDYRQIHDNTPTEHHVFEVRRKHSGFCYDHVQNTFKVVRIVFYSSITRGNVANIRTFSLCSNSLWESKDRVLREKIFCRNATCVQTHMYWHIFEEDRDGNTILPLKLKYILCFDMVSEQFRRIEYPGFDSHIPQCIRLVPYDGTIAFFYQFGGYWKSSDTYLDVWVIDDNQSWHKILAQLPTSKGTYPLGFFVKDMTYSVAFNNSGQFFYTSETGDSKEISATERTPPYLIPQFFLYNESAVSVTG